MGRKFLLFLALNCYSFLLAQKESNPPVEDFGNLGQIDSKNLSNNEIDSLLEISKNIHVEKPALVLEYLKQLKPEIEKNEHYSAWVDYCYLIQRIYTEKGELKEAEKLIAEIYDTHAKGFSPEEDVSIRFNLASLSSDLGDTEKSQEIVRAILPKAQTDFQRASIYFQSAFNLKRTGSYTESTKDALKAIELYKSIQDWKNTAVAYDFLGTIYNQIQNYDKAIYYSRKGFEYALKSANYLAEMSISGNLGVYYKAQNKMDSAVYYYNHSLSLARKYGSAKSIAQNLMNLGNIYSEFINDYPKAEKYYKESLAISQKSGLLYGVYLNWFNIGRNYHLEKKYKNAIEAYDSALYYTKKINSPSDESAVYEGFYLLYKETGNYPEALANYEKHNALKEKINIENAKKEITEIQAKYDVALKDKEITEVNNRYEIQKFRNRILYLALFFLLAGAGAFIYFLIYRNKTLKKLYERNVELTQSAFSFENLVKEENPEPLKRIFEKLVELMESEKIYAEPNLTINSIAQKLQTNRSYLSSSISTYAEMNFNNFINSYRIREAKRLILQNPNLSLNEVMYMCGFNSRTPFYMSFQKCSGMSPQQFKDLSGSKQEKQIPEEDLIEH